MDKPKEKPMDKEKVKKIIIRFSKRREVILLLNLCCQPPLVLELPKGLIGGGQVETKHIEPDFITHSHLYHRFVVGAYNGLDT